MCHCKQINFLFINQENKIYFISHLLTHNQEVLKLGLCALTIVIQFLLRCMNTLNWP